MYAVHFTDKTITPLNGTNDFAYASYQQFETYKEAKRELINYWIGVKDDAEYNIKEVMKMKE